MTVGPNRWRFLKETLDDLNQNLKKINSRLYVVRGNYTDTFPKLFKDWDVSLLTFESDIEPYSVKRDAVVRDMAKKFKVDIIEECSHTIFNPELVVQKNKGSPPMTYQRFASIASELKAPQPVDDPPVLPKSLIPELDENEQDDESCYDVPSMAELNVDPNSFDGKSRFPGGETEALKRMKEKLSNTNWVCNFEKPQTSPNSLELSTTGLSPYLKFGCLSSRLFYQKIKDIYRGRKHSNPPTSLEGQLIWREFYYTVAAVTPNFDKMEGSKICTQIPWKTRQDYYDAWKFGQTGYPFIDAIMRQLRLEGWIHHLARHAVACFFTRGDLWCHWEDGQKVFEEYLIDADWALNAGNWLWLSASAFFHQYYRVYSPIAFGKKTDPEGKFIKKYCPELKNYPSGSIYEPWKVSLENQKKYGCIIGKDYPKRIVDHETIHKENLTKMNAAYAKKKANKEDPKRKAESPTASSAGSSKKKAKGESIDKFFKKK
jgi:cryptochrome